MCSEEYVVFLKLFAADAALRQHASFMFPPETFHPASLHQHLHNIVKGVLILQVLLGVEAEVYLKDLSQWL